MHDQQSFFPSSGICYFLNLTFIEEPNSVGDEVNASVTSLVLVLKFDNTLHPSLYLTQSKITFIVPHSYALNEKFLL